MVNYKNSKMLGYLFVIPLCIFVLIFMVYPVIYNVQNSFWDWNGIASDKTFIGIQNYMELFRDPVFKTVLKNFVLFAVFTVGVQCILGLLIANLFRKKFWGRDFSKAVIFMPAVLSSVIIGQIFFRIMDPNVGYLNSFFKAIGMDFLAGSWLSNPKTAFFVIIIINIWQWTGYSVTLYYGAMMGISNDLYEAAKIDGANGFQILRSITVPLVRGTTYNLTIIGVIGALKQYDLVSVMTGGGPANSTQTFASYMYQASFGTYRQGYASAIAFACTIQRHFIRGGQEMKKTEITSKAVTYLVTLLLVAVILIPILILVYGSLKGGGLQNYIDVLTNYDIQIYFKNSIIVTLIVVVLVVFMDILAGFALSKLQFPGKNFIYIFLLSALLLPAAAIMVPVFQISSGMGILNTYVSLVGPYIVLIAPFNLLTVKNGFDALPNTVLEAAMIDGCSTFKALWKIAVPMCRPSIMMAVIWTFLSSWNEYLFASIMLREESMMTITVIPTKFQQMYGGNTGKLFASLFIIIVPVMIVYFVLQKFVTSGMTDGAVKE